MIDNFDGQPLLDESGEQIGTVERTYVDDAGNARLLAVKLGHLLGKHRLVPADQARSDDAGVWVPYTVDTISESPHIDTGDMLEGEGLDEVRSYYNSPLAGTADDAEEQTATTMPSGTEGDTESVRAEAVDIPTEPAPENLGQIRDLGDVIEVPIVEEILVRKPVVREVLRVKKTESIERQIASADLRREDVEVVPSREGLLVDEAESEDANTGA